MAEQSPCRPNNRLITLLRAARPRLRHAGRYATLALVLAAGVGVCASATVGAPAFASGEKNEESGGSPGESTSTSNCPSSNPPNQLTLIAGTPQTATLNTPFTVGLQVALTNSDGCPVTGAAGVPVTFTAPAKGAGGHFSNSNSNTATVGADASGSVSAPTFTADGVAGGYTVTAGSPYGSVSFALTNAAVTVGVWCPTLGKRASISPGEPVKLTPGVGSTQSTVVGAGFSIPLAVTVTDADGNPVPGTPVIFSAPARGASGLFAVRRSGGPHRRRSPVYRARRVTVKTNACGIAVAPSFTADHEPGGYIVKATVKRIRPAAFALVNEAPDQSL